MKQAFPKESLSVWLNYCGPLYTVSSSIVSQPCRTKCLWLLLIGRLSPPCSYLISQAGALTDSQSAAREEGTGKNPTTLSSKTPFLKFFILITSCSFF